MSWGARFVGFGSMMDSIDGLQSRLDDDAVWVVGTDKIYGVYQEFGTKNMRAQPYLRPAARDAERNIERITAPANSVEEAIKRVALHIERESKKNAPVDTGALRSSLRAERIR